MSLERWQPHRKAIVVRARSGGGVLVRPRRMSPWMGVAIGTSVAAGLSLSAAIVQVQTEGAHWPGGMLAAVALSVAVVLLQGHAYRHHPERWRFFAWWCAFVLAKLAFVEKTFLVVLPIELLGLAPAWWTVRRASRMAEGDLVGMTLADSDVAHIQVADTDLTGADLRRARFTDVRFERCRFNGVDASEAVFHDCTFIGCDFRDARLFATKWFRVDAQGCFFARATLATAEFEAADLRSADFENADLCGTKFWQGDGIDSRLENARLAGARYDGRTSWTGDVKPGQSGAMKVD